MERYSRYNSVTAVGIYCLIQAHKAPLTLGVANPVPKIFASARLYCAATGAPTAGSVQPVRLAADGNYYPLAAASSVTAAGLVFDLETCAPINAVAIQVLQAVVGGTLYLQSDGIEV